MMHNNGQAELQEYAYFRVQFPEFSTEPYGNVSYLSLTYKRTSVTFDNFRDTHEEQFIDK